MRPFLETYCLDCHAGERPKAELDLDRYSEVQSMLAGGEWIEVRKKLVKAEMPPADDEQPSAKGRQAVVAFIDEVARRHAADPGVVLARRLSNAEYNASIRDLTGVDIRPAREFPVDPANPAGFDNSGESLVMSPALMKKYLQGAREVASHLVLGPTGIAFAPHPMLVETDRDKYCVTRIVDFYRRQRTDYADYFLGAWRFKHRRALGSPRASLRSLATQEGLSEKYLTLVWKTLEKNEETVGPIARLQAMWRRLPPPGAAESEAKAGALAMRDFVVELRKKIELRFEAPRVEGLSRNSQPFLMWRNRAYATHRRDYDRQALQIGGESAKPDADLLVKPEQRAAAEAGFAHFASVFPDAFYVSERGRNYLDKTRDKGRLLSAGFHNLMGYFRDDQPLYELILDEAGQKELDALWRELDYVAAATHRTYLQFYFNESGEARKRAAESTTQTPAPAAGGGDVGQDVTSPAEVMRLKQVFLERARPSGNETALAAIAAHFDTVNATLRWVEKAQEEAEPRQLEALLGLAARAYRRPLTTSERQDLLAYYRSLREQEDLDHAAAMRDVLVSVLMSPDFCYRIDLVDAGPKARPLDDYALASRLSYFLWSSLPDEELLAHARAKDLHRPKVLLAQTRRMLKDPRVRGLVTEFGGHWLDFRRFEEHNAVDRARFPSFDNELRRSMFEEPLRFFEDLVRADRSVLDLLFAEHTFVNAPLAKHYGLPQAPTDAETWVRVDEAGRWGRGGILPMAVFLTKNAPGLRTSPVKRGYWVVKSVLGERIPPPPAMVPELPRDEAETDLPMRELLAQHREEPTCAACHARFDAMGLVFEGYGPVGETRSQDLAGRPVDAKTSFPGGGEGDGLAGLRQYLRERRQDDFVDNVARKLLSYALGRSLVLSDEVTVARMRKNLARDGHHFGSLVQSVVVSPQFLTKRGLEPALAVRSTP